jgi:hypothetical protein
LTKVEPPDWSVSGENDGDGEALAALASGTIDNGDASAIIKSTDNDSIDFGRELPLLPGVALDFLELIISLGSVERERRS